MRLNDTRGSMPFALIAVAILLVSVAAGAVAAGYQQGSDDAAETERELDSIDAAISDVTVHVNSGIGDMVGWISADADLGSLSDRAETFAERCGEWMDSQFPMTSRGARITLSDYSIDLAAMPADISSYDGTDGCTPSYLKAVGTADISVESGESRSDTTVDVFTDGSYSLPLAVERAAMFESMASNGGSTLSQMLQYGLTALAEYRAMNGYGGLSEHGERGTRSLITTADVERTLENAMEALGAECFRDGGLASSGSVDLADLLVDGGTIEIDLSAVYAQALLSVVDDLVLRWMDYLYGFDIFQDIWESLHPFREALRSLERFLKGEKAYSGVPYLRDAMSSFGYSEGSYRYIGGGTATVEVDGLEVTVDRPTVDLFSQRWLTSFKRTYEREADRNYVENLLMGAIKGAAADIAENRRLGTVAVAVDPYDGTGFMDSLVSLYRDAVSDCSDSVRKGMLSSLASAECYDEFYGALVDDIHDHVSELADTDALYASIRSAFETEIERMRAEQASEEGSEGASEAPSGDDPGGGASPAEDPEIPDIDNVMASMEVRLALAEYRANVYSELSIFDGLGTMRGSEDGLLKKVLRRICTFGIGLLDPVQDRIDSMVDEMLSIDGTNPCSGPIDLPGTDGFLLRDGDGGTTEEHLDLDADLDAVWCEVSLARAVHTVGFDGNPDAAYTAVLSVRVSGMIGYTVTGTGSLSGAMGTVSSAYRGHMPLELTVEVPVVTAWALEGIVYEPSTTLLKDLYETLVRLFEPIIEPLKRLVGMMRSALEELGRLLIDGIGTVSGSLMELYSALIDPVSEIGDMISGFAEDAVYDILVSIGLGEQSITVDFMGCSLELKTSAVSWAARTKTVMSALMTVPVGGYTVTAGIDVKIRGSPEKGNVIITGNGGIRSDDWSVDATVDPLMKGGKYLFTVTGKAGKNRVSLVAPKLEDYKEMGLTLSDVPGIGGMLDSIPVPMLGVNIGLDAGFQIRCKDPSVTGVLINEYESNPPGEDKGHEYVEIYNGTDSSVDLDGWTLNVKGKKKAASMPLSGTLAPGALITVYPTFTLVNTASDRLILRDAEDQEADSVKMRADSANDDLTWQREYDGSPTWVQKKGTPDGSNGSPILHSIDLDDLAGCAWKGVQRAFDRIGTITDLDSLSLFVQYLVRYTLEAIIDRVAGLLIDASVFVSGDVMDMTSSASAGIRVALRTDGDLAKDCLRYIAGQVGSMVLGLRNPYSIDPVGMFTENIDLEVLCHAGIGFPRLLSKGADLPQMDLGLVVRTNLASLTRILGEDTGRPEIEFGVLARDCPAAAVPSRLHPSAYMDHDLWLFKGSVRLERRKTRTLYRVQAMGWNHGRDGLQDTDRPLIRGADGEGVPQGFQDPHIGRQRPGR